MVAVTESITALAINGATLPANTVFYQVTHTWRFFYYQWFEYGSDEQIDWSNTAAKILTNASLFDCYMNGNTHKMNEYLSSILSFTWSRVHVFYFVKLDGQMRALEH